MHTLPTVTDGRADESYALGEQAPLPPFRRRLLSSFLNVFVQFRPTSKVHVTVVARQTGQFVFEARFRDQKGVDGMVATICNDPTHLSVTEFEKEYGINRSERAEPQ